MRTARVGKRLAAHCGVDPLWHRPGRSTRVALHALQGPFLRPLSDNLYARDSNTSLHLTVRVNDCRRLITDACNDSMSYSQTLLMYEPQKTSIVRLSQTLTNNSIVAPELKSQFQMLHQHCASTLTLRDRGNNYMWR